MPRASVPAAAADRQLLRAIDSLHELVVHLPTLAAQQLVQPPVAEPAALAGKGTQTLAQTIVVPRSRLGALSTTEREIPTSLQARRRESPCSSWAIATACRRAAGVTSFLRATP